MVKDQKWVKKKRRVSARSIKTMTKLIQDSKSTYHAKYYQNNKEKLKYKAKRWQHVNKIERHKTHFIKKRVVLMFD
jgi:hypothetical protein